MFRRVLAVAMLAFAVIGLLPLVPSAFGFKTATVTNDSTGTFFPTANNGTVMFITCGQTTVAGANWNVQLNTLATNLLFKCRNNWNSAVDVTITLVDGNSRIVTINSGPATNIPAGGTVCVKVTNLQFANANIASGTVVYKGTATASDLFAQFEFDGNVRISGGGAAPPQCV